MYGFYSQPIRDIDEFFRKFEQREAKINIKDVNLKSTLDPSPDTKKSNKQKKSKKSKETEIENNEIKNFIKYICTPDILATEYFIIQKIDQVRIEFTYNRYSLNAKNSFGLLSNKQIEDFFDSHKEEIIKILKKRIYNYEKIKSKNLKLARVLYIHHDNSIELSFNVI